MGTTARRPFERWTTCWTRANPSPSSSWRPTSLAAKFFEAVSKHFPKNTSRTTKETTTIAFVVLFSNNHYPKKSDRCTTMSSSLLPPLLRIDRTRYYTHTDMIDLEPPSRL